MFYYWVPRIFRNCKSVQILPPPACLPALLLWPSPLCSTARHTGPARGHLLLALASHASRQSCRRSSTPHAGASSLCHAPRTACRPPPRRRHGWLAAAPQDPNSRVHQHPEHHIILFHSFLRRFLAPRLQNTTRHHHCRR